MRGIGAFRLALMGVVLNGCSPYLQGTAGYASPVYDAGGLRGGALNAHGGLNLVDGSVVTAAGVHVRSRFSERLNQAGLGAEVMFRYPLKRSFGKPVAWVPCEGTPPGQTCREAVYPFVEPVEIYGRTGLGLLQLGAFDGDFALATLSPVGEFGFVVSVLGEDVPLLTLGTALEHDVRFDDHVGPTTMSFLLGVGLMKIGRPSAGGGGFFGR